MRAARLEPPDSAGLDGTTATMWVRLAGSLEEIGSVRCGPNREIEAGSLGKRPKIPVSRKQRNPAIDTTLGDQGIAEAGLVALRQHLRS